MSLTPLFLPRLRFAFTISYHIIFPSYTIGLAAWLAVLEGLRLATGLPVYRRLFDFWLKIFAIAFGLGVVSGDVAPKCYPAVSSLLAVGLPSWAG